MHKCRCSIVACFVAAVNRNGATDLWVVNNWTFTLFRFTSFSVFHFRQTHEKKKTVKHHKRLCSNKYTRKINEWRQLLQAFSDHSLQCIEMSWDDCHSKIAERNWEIIELSHFWKKAPCDWLVSKCPTLDWRHFLRFILQEKSRIVFFILFQQQKKEAHWNFSKHWPEERHQQRFQVTLEYNPFFLLNCETAVRCYAYALFICNLNDTAQMNKDHNNKLIMVLNQRDETMN